MRRAVLRSNYTRRGLLSRTLNLRNALFLHKEKSAGRPTQLGDNYSVPSESGQLFRADPCRNAIFLSVFLPSFVSLSLSFSLSLLSEFVTLTLSSVDQCQKERSISRCEFLPIHDIPNDFPRELRKSRKFSGKFSRKKTLQSCTFCSLVRLFIGHFYSIKIIAYTHVLFSPNEK